MPYKKPTTPFIELSRLLKGYDLNAPALATVLGCSANTARTKLANPERFSLKELQLISRKGHIPATELMSAIKI